MRFYLGTHQPAWLARLVDIPMMVSRRRLAGRRQLPRATSDWALDSGGFTELSMHGRWHIDAHTYVREVRRYTDEIGRLHWAAPMDWMTEDHVLARTGASLLTHQRRTVDNFRELRDIAPDLPFIPVLQGQTVRDYHRCADLYEHHGIDLAEQPLVGLGSVCRRQHSRDVEEIVRSMAERAPHLHAFGVKTLGLRCFADVIASSDSAAWSLRGRYVRGCSSSHRRESNCLSFALRWRTQLTNSLDNNDKKEAKTRTKQSTPPTNSRPKPDRTKAATFNLSGSSTRSHPGCTKTLRHSSSNRACGRQYDEEPRHARSI
jgi:hypothetical protein